MKSLPPEKKITINGITFLNVPYVPDADGEDVSPEEIVVVSASKPLEDDGELLPDFQTATGTTLEDAPPLEPKCGETPKSETPAQPASKASSSTKQRGEESSKRLLLDPAKVEAARNANREVDALFAMARGETEPEASTRTEPIVMDGRSRGGLLQALINGQTPAGFARYHLVGRSQELREIWLSLNRVSNGASELWCLTGPIGVGKTFFAGLATELAASLDMAFAVVDLEPKVHFGGTQGQSRKLIGKLMQAIQTPAGKGIRAILDCLADKVGVNFEKDTADLQARLRRLFEPLENHQLADPFRRVLNMALDARIKGNAEIEDRAVRWIAAKYDTAKEAKEELGVGTILDDDHVLDYLSLVARSIVICGWRGLIVVIDEASVISNYLPKPARDANWNQILHTVNSMHNGGAPHLGLILAGTEDLIHKERGLLSNPSLESRLAPVASGDGAAALGPIIRLRRFSREEYYLLLQGFRDLIFPLEERNRFPDEAIEAFLNKIFSVLGADQSLTTRDVLRQFAVAAKELIASPELDWSTLQSRHITKPE
jgi:hypothetical protein